MYNGMIINDLMAAVERAERRVATSAAIDNMKVIEIPADLLAEFSYADELVVA